jgi:zinc/manganese transport system substrate-binding protein
MALLNVIKSRCWDLWWFSKCGLLAFLILANLGMGERPPIKNGSQIRVVASIPDLADLAARIGGDLVSVESLAKGVEDPHGVPIKPSFVPKLNRADALVVLGLQAHHAWLPALIDVARNPAILPGNAGYIDCSVNITVKQIPKSLLRREGDVHPLGNPHVNLDPVNAALMAKEMVVGFSRVYPPGQAVFERNLKKFTTHLSQQMVKWEKMAELLQGVKFVSYHQDTIYFAERFGLEEVGQIEIRPGIEPTQGHLVWLINRMKKEGVTLILREPHFGEQLPNWVAQQTGASVAKFLIMVGGNPGVDTYEDLIEFNLQSIVTAIQSRQSHRE